MNAEQTSDDQALDRLLDDLFRSAVAEIQALEQRSAPKNEPNPMDDALSDEDDEGRYSETVARPLGEAALASQLTGSTLISEDRGE
jgi:hypothetical protein